MPDPGSPCGPAFSGKLRQFFQRGLLQRLVMAFAARAQECEFLFRSGQGLVAQRFSC